MNIIEMMTVNTIIIKVDIRYTDSLNVRYNFKTNMAKMDRKKHPVDMKLMKYKMDKSISSRMISASQYLKVNRRDNELTLLAQAHSKHNIKHTLNVILIFRRRLILMIAITPIAHCSSNAVILTDVFVILAPVEVFEISRFKYPSLRTVRMSPIAFASFNSIQRKVLLNS